MRRDREDALSNRSVKCLILLSLSATLAVQASCARASHRGVSQCGDFGDHAPSATSDHREPETTPYPRLKPIPGKPGFYFIPDGPGGYIDGRGLSKGTVVRSPGTGNRFRIP